MVHHQSLFEKVDSLIKEESLIFGNNPKEYSEQAKDRFYQELKAVLEKYNKEYLEDLGTDFIRMYFPSQLIQNQHKARIH